MSRWWPICETVLALCTICRCDRWIRGDQGQKKPSAGRNLTKVEGSTVGSRRSGDCVNDLVPATAFSGILTQIPIPPNRENSYISGLISGCALGTVDGASAAAVSR
jgi:hypothetical protein